MSALGALISVVNMVYLTRQPWFDGGTGQSREVNPLHPCTSLQAAVYSTSLRLLQTPVCTFLTVSCQCALMTVLTASHAHLPEHLYSAESDLNIATIPHNA